MDSERLNLHAAVEYAARTSRLGHAISLPLAMHGFLRTQGYWDQALALHYTAIAAARQDGDQLCEAGALSDLALCGA